jgi:predicted transcriptional regulator of viral defense system
LAPKGRGKSADWALPLKLDCRRDSFRRPLDRSTSLIQDAGTCCQMPASSNKFERASRLLAREGVARLRDLEAKGIARAQVLRWAEAGKLQRVGRGLYALPTTDLGEYEGVVQATKLVPVGIVCLLSALQIHEMTTQNPSEVWLGIPRKTRKPRVPWPPLHLVWWSGAALTTGVVETRLAGVVVRVTSPARTVADCFKHRSIAGLDVAIEALRDFRRARKGTIDELHEMASVCRVKRVMQPYLEAVV